MRRGELTRIFVLLTGGAALVLWLIYATRPEAQIHAREARPANRIETPASVSINQLANENLPTETENPPSNETEPADIVPVGPRSTNHRTNIENVSGPEFAPGLTPATVLQNMRSVVRDYSARFGGNPFGNNREITAKLNGGNSKQVVFLKEEDGMRINGRGELIDNWGTPFFFHQISAAEMEIRSAGPDRKMWTADDLIFK